MDLPTVCCMCGDIGFADKLFLCSKCQRRHQHSYCSGYQDGGRGVCDWCQSEEIRRLRSQGGGQVRKTVGKEAKGSGDRSNFSGNKIKGHVEEEEGRKDDGSMSSSPSPKTAGRRYKLLKDVIECTGLKLPR